MLGFCEPGQVTLETVRWDATRESGPCSVETIPFKLGPQESHLVQEIIWDDALSGCGNTSEAFLRLHSQASQPGTF